MSSNHPVCDMIPDANAPLVRRLPWSPMRLKYLGDAAELLQSSKGKLSTNGPDTGDKGNIRKRRGAG